MLRSARGFVAASRLPLPAAGDWRAASVSALLMLPQAVTFAVLAGLPPEMGLYAAALPVIVAALLSPSPTQISGPNTAVAVMLGCALAPLATPGSHDYIVMAAALTAAVALVQLLLALAGAGGLLARCPPASIAGLNLGIGGLMLAGQVAPLLGLTAVHDLPLLSAAWVQLQRAAECNPSALGLASLSLCCGLAWARRGRRGVWAPVVALLAGALATALLDAGWGPAATQLERLGAVRLQWPAWQMPELAGLAPYALKQLAVHAVEIAVVASLQSAILLHSALATVAARDCRRELMAQASSNLVAAAGGGFAGSASFNRTAVHQAAGALTPAAAVLSTLLLVGGALLAAPALARLPHAVIAGTLALVAVQMMAAGWAAALRQPGRRRLMALGVAALALVAGIVPALLLVLLTLVVEALASRSPGP
ncbi:SulP family inorganic anion transporter [Roseateles sp. DXS20W]|uniref:SulP family inorganic anion transporter n=1 Tax=Pelomonas lactea TaxID=3299030 RepID=A0ABW7GSJ1_9BURK